MANMAKADFDKIVDLLKTNKTIGELNVLFGQGPNRDGTKLKDNGSIGYVHAIVLFTEGAFNGKQAEQYVQNCYVFSQYSTGSARSTVAQNACARINGTKSDMVIFNKHWKNYLIQNKYPPLTPATKLKQVLVYIMGFLVKNYSSTVVGKDNPNADNFIYFLANTCGVSAKGTTKMKDVATEKISDAIENSAKKCVIFTGAPGTGKTYCVEEYVREKMKGTQFEGKKDEYFVQFHSSYDYTDFVEGLRPIKKDDKDDAMIFVRMDGIFKAFCRKVVERNKKWDEENAGNKANAAQSENQEKEASEEKPPEEAEVSADEAMNGENREEETSEENFQKEAEASTDEAVNGQKTSKEKPNYYFVIDEINRADLGRVFGELMYCFEKRGEDHRIATQYTNLPAYGRDGKPIANDCFKDGFYIPKNVVIIGTMNDIDRSVETFDFALRRRFDWVEIEADEVMESSLKNMMKKWLEEEGYTVNSNIVSDIVEELLPRITDMNTEIKYKSGLGPEFKIGPAYFNPAHFKKCYDKCVIAYNRDVHDALEKALKDVWERNIEPILREYIRGRQDDGTFIENCRNALFSKNDNEVNKNKVEKGGDGSDLKDDAATQPESQPSDNTDDQ